jgi:hypothetical protein
MYFFHIHPLLIAKLGNALGSLHAGPPLSVVHGNILTPTTISVIVNDTKSIRQ